MVSRPSWIPVLLVTALLACKQGSHVTATVQCMPGNTCWPNNQTWTYFISSLDGYVNFPSDAEYDANMMHNTIVSRFPYIMVMAESVDDVIKSVKFGTKFDIKITVLSSGHDYVGRATADRSLQINLKRMKGLKFNLGSSRNQAGEVTAESGNTWPRVYNETHRRGRTIVGGAPSCMTVSMGGYTLGGGLSALGRKFGLAVDNLVEIQMVAANGSLVYANNNSTVVMDTETGQNVTVDSTDIFWAVRGGGGSTFGIVTSFTFKLHYDSAVVDLTCRVPYMNAHGEKTGEAFMKYFNNLLSTSLSPEWGGYEFYTGHPVTPNTSGSVSLNLVHFGGRDSKSFISILPFLDKYKAYCSLANRSASLEYGAGGTVNMQYKMYTMNILLGPESFSDQLYDFVHNLTLNNLGGDGSFGCLGTLIGGNMNRTKDNATAINSALRTAVLSLTCALTWHSDVDKTKVDIADKIAAQFLRFGHGTYLNEPSVFLPGWKNAYWGDHYGRLLQIKRLWDPSNVFSCYHCVGYEEFSVDPIIG